MNVYTMALIPLLPLLAALVTCAMKNGRHASRIAILAMLVSCQIAIFALGEAWKMPPDSLQVFNFTWLSAGEVTINFGFLLDHLSAAMAAMVTFVGLLIFTFSIGYMEKDPRMARFFCYLSLFASGMLGLILANNLLLMFMCWEIVGVASYLLISFWYHKPEAAAAGKKAFIVTRIGDLGFLLGILLAYKYGGTLDLYMAPTKGMEVTAGTGLLEVNGLSAVTATIGGIKVVTVVSLLLFCGAIGKSGQLPLHVWLPDAMEGPTPVSALIHAATMVAAGVFLVARAMPIFEAGEVLPLVAWVGAITALVAAFIALGQYDIKRILAYSTVSQLGLMMVGLGVGGVAVGMFHLLTHAFFKALLFLGAGSIIHGCHEEQDIRKMGGLWKSMRTTSITYLCGTAALIALPYVTAGFYSKDQILAAAYQKGMMPVFWIAAAASLLTAVYMTRQCLYVFRGDYRGEGTPHESPGVMTMPLCILAVFALGMGAVFEGTLFQKFEGKILHPQFVIMVSIAVAVGGVVIGWLVYAGRRLGGVAKDPLAVAPLENKLWFDELYENTVLRLWNLTALVWEQINELLLFARDMFVAVARALSSAFAIGGDRRLIDAFAFDGLCDRLRESGRHVNDRQDGFLSGYLRLIALGAVLLGVLIFWIR
ncbi:MAG: NADH-quinone oxidoreductase subunit L [Verrucomicrobiales bacterium]|nr:NADH-quinone oxidoreductase subunit L [Verrucomicrobiales bacterium]